MEILQFQSPLIRKHWNTREAYKETLLSSVASDWMVEKWNLEMHIPENFKIPLWNYNSITVIQQHLIIYVYQLTIADL